MKQQLLKAGDSLYSTYTGDMSLAITEGQRINNVVVEHRTVVDDGGGIFVTKYYPQEVDFLYKKFDGETTIEYYTVASTKTFLGISLPARRLSDGMIRYNERTYKREWLISSHALAFWENRINNKVMYDLRKKIFSERQLKFTEDFLWRLLLPVLNPLREDLRVITR